MRRSRISRHPRCRETWRLKQQWEERETREEDLENQKPQGLSSSTRLERASSRPAKPVDASIPAAFVQSQLTAQEHFVDSNAVAEHLSVKRRQILEMTRRGIIPGHPLGIGRSRRVWRYKISEVEAAIASGARKSPACEMVDGLAPDVAPSTMSPGSSPSQRRKSNG